ncbi:MAG: rhomboid family intramembrane serine protease [Phycisphaeraceae bacterium]|nr:rhomboid family intramembrane serine protease [Phycisphaeraceae bacterium]
MRPMWRDWPWVTGIGVGLAVLVTVMGWSEAAAMTREAQPAWAWGARLITCHGSHFGTNHLFWDAATLAVLGAAAERMSRRQMVVTLLVSSLAISLAVWVGRPELTAYRGLSGLDSALFGLVLVSVGCELARGGRWAAMGIVAAGAAGFVGKTAFELATGQTLFVAGSAEFVGVPLAHIVGFVVGAAAAIKGVEWRGCGPSVTGRRAGWCSMGEGACS